MAASETSDSVWEQRMTEATDCRRLASPPKKSPIPKSAAAASASRTAMATRASRVSSAPGHYGPRSAAGTTAMPSVRREPPSGRDDDGVDQLISDALLRQCRWRTLTYRFSGGTLSSEARSAPCAARSTGRCVMTVLAGCSPRPLSPLQFVAGLTGLGTNPPPQFGQTLPITLSTHVAQKVHSKLQM